MSNAIVTKRRSTDGNWWLSGGISSANAIGAYQAVGAADYATSKINLANPGTYNLSTVSNDPTFSAITGWDFNGVNGVLNTGIVPGSGWSIIAKFTDSIGTNTIVMGAATGGLSVYLMSRRGAADDHIYANGTFLATGVRLTNGVMCVAGLNCYLDGSGDGTISGTLPTTITASFYIGGQNNGGVRQQLLNGKIQAVAIYDTIITGTQVAAVTAAMNAL